MPNQPLFHVPCPTRTLSQGTGHCITPHIPTTGESAPAAWRPLAQEDSSSRRPRQTHHSHKRLLRHRRCSLWPQGSSPLLGTPYTPSKASVRGKSCWPGQQTPTYVPSARPVVAPWSTKAPARDCISPHSRRGEPSTPQEQPSAGASMGNCVSGSSPKAARTGRGEGCRRWPLQALTRGRGLRHACPGHP